MQIFLDIHQKEVVLPPGEIVRWRIAVYPLVLSHEGKVLLVSQNHDQQFLMLPGGEVEMHESITECLQRECYEETGYRITVDSLIPYFIGESHFYLNGFFHCINMVYRASLSDTIQDVAAINANGDNEIKAVEWKEPTELTKENCHPIIFPAIQMLQERSSTSLKHV